MLRPPRLVVKNPTRLRSISGNLGSGQKLEPLLGSVRNGSEADTRTREGRRRPRLRGWGRT
jgi:hypothetical protein